RGVAERGVLGVHVQIARVPAGPAHLRPGAEAGLPVGLVRERRVAGELRPDAPGDLAVGVAERLAGDRGEPELGVPAAGRGRAGPEAARGLARHVALGIREVLRLGREALARDGHVRVAGAAPAAELARAGQLVAAAQRIVEAEVERVAHVR